MSLFCNKLNFPTILFLGKRQRGVVVPPSAPRTAAGLYWGYSVRLARSLSAVLTEGMYKGGYDCLIGTSERGEDVDAMQLDKFR